MKPRTWKLVKGKWRPVPREEDVVEEVMKRLWLQYKIKVWRVRERIPGVGALSTPGIPDLMGWIPAKPLMSRLDFGDEIARPLFIECKRPGGVHRIAQTRFIEDAKSDGCVAFFAESWGDVVKEMDLQCGIKLKEAA